MEFYKCECCNGTGKKPDIFGDDRSCTKCHGEGELNWIENIFGKQEQSEDWFKIYSPSPGYWNTLELATGEVLDKIAQIMGIPSRYLKGKSEQNKKDIIMKGIKNG